MTIAGALSSSHRKETKGSYQRHESFTGSKVGNQKKIKQKHFAINSTQQLRKPNASAQIQS